MTIERWVIKLSGCQVVAVVRYGFQLRDLTTGETVFDLKSRDWSERVGVAHVDEVNSTEGIPISRSHRYEVVVEYDNTTDHEIDAMGILFLYLLEKNFTPKVQVVRWP
jgi:hypothetical protein